MTTTKKAAKAAPKAAKKAAPKAAKDDPKAEAMRAARARAREVREATIESLDAVMTRPAMRVMAASSMTGAERYSGLRKLVGRIGAEAEWVAYCDAHGIET